MLVCLRMVRRSAVAAGRCCRSHGTPRIHLVARVLPSVKEDKAPLESEEIGGYPPPDPESRVSQGRGGSELERDFTYIDGTVTVCVGAVDRRTASTTEEAECHMIDLATGIW